MRAPAWSRGARRSRETSAHRSATTSTGVDRSPASVIHGRDCSSPGSHRPPTARTEPDGCSPATVRVTGSSGRCTAPGSRTSRRRCRATTAFDSRGAWITAAVRCAPPANKPTPEERDRCQPYLERELALLPDVRVIVALGAFGYEAVWRTLGASGRLAPGPAPEVRPRRSRSRRPAPWSSGRFHPSQQNTFTGKLTEPMLDAVFARALALAGCDRMPAEASEEGEELADGRRRRRSSRARSRS